MGSRDSLGCRVALAGTCALALSLIGPADASAQPRSDASASGELVLSSVFDDASWVDIDVEASVGAEDPTAPSAGGVDASGAGAGGAAGGGGGGGGGGRGSIDVDLVTSIVTDRARQLAMRAVADAMEAGGGVIASRRYVQDLLGAAQRLLTDRVGMHRTNVEDLVSVLVRVVIADALVRSRFPNGTVDDPCHWRVIAFGEEPEYQHEGARAWITRSRREAPSPEVDDAARGREFCRDAVPASPRRNRHPLLAAERCTDPTTRRDAPECDLRATSATPGWQPWLPSSSTSALALRAYLVDLAYWSISGSPLFAAPRRAPTCALSGRDRALCEFVTGRDGGARNDTELARRISWLLDLRRVLDGLSIARSVQRLWRRARTAGLRGLLRAVAESTSVGSFRATEGLRPSDWSRAGAASAWARMLLTLARTSQASDRFCQSSADPRPLGALLEVARQAREARTALCDESSAGSRVSHCDDTELEAWLGGSGLEERAKAVVQAPERLDAAACRAALSGGPTVAALVRAVDPPLGRPSREDVRRALEQVDEAAGRAADSAARLSELTAGAERVEDIELAHLGAWSREATDLSEALRAVRAGMEAHAIRALVSTGARGLHRDVSRSADATTGLARLLWLVAHIGDEMLDRLGSLHVGEVTRALRGLAGTARGAMPLVELVMPVLGRLRDGEPLGMDVLLTMASRLRVRDVVLALGLDAAIDDACADESSLACWTVRIVQALREATTIDGERIRVDGGRLGETLGALGEDFRRREEWRWYFHLTIGLGEMWSLVRPNEAGDAAWDPRFLPVVAEQIGIGYASPSFLGDRLAVRFGVFGSGILYRIVIDSTESSAVMFGGFAAADLYELLELYVAPLVMLYPPSGGASLDAGFGIAFGAQVPLGDYLSRL